MVCFEAAVVFYLMREYDRGLETVDRTLEIDPHFPLALWIRAFLLGAVARHAEAVEEAERSIAMAGHVPLFQAAVPHALATAGRYEEARRHLDQLVQLSKREYVPEILFASVYARLGDEAATLATVELAANQGCSTLHSFLSSVGFDFVRHHPRFARVAEKIRCPELVHLPPEPARRADTKRPTAI
jgi:tetratricopeptide (TPR) repeat protein